jgi:hypothetical protein
VRIEIQYTWRASTIPSLAGSGQPRRRITATASNVVVLFGSRAGGDARSGSDYDFAVFFRNFDGFGKEEVRNAAKARTLLDELSS